MGICEAAETFGIPQLTLGDKLHGKRAPTVTVSGKDTLLLKAVEDPSNINVYFIYLIAVVLTSIILNTKC